MKTLKTKFIAVLLATVFVLSCGIGVPAKELSPSGEDVSTGNMELQATPSNYLTLGYNKARQNYAVPAGGTKILNGYWAVFGAYATYSDLSKGFRYDDSSDDPAQNGAKALAIIMMGENPYNYNGVNYIAKIEAKTNLGSFAVPVFDFLALQAAGAEIPAAKEQAYITYCCNQMKDLTLGPDIGGWALSAVADYADNPTYASQIKAAADSYIGTVSKNMTGESMGSAGLSMGCVVTGLTAYDAVGHDGCDVVNDEPWITLNPLATMWQNLDNGEYGVSSNVYNHYYFMEFADLYQVTAKDGEPAWHRCQITKSQLNTRLTEAEKILAAPGNYTDLGIERLQTAYAAAKTVPSAKLEAKNPTWGKTYFDLVHALTHCSEKGNPSGFTDIKAGSWYEANVKEIITQKIMNGVSATVFSPNVTLSRAMMVQILWNLEGAPAHTADCPFKDVPAASWFSSAVMWAYETGITGGTSATTFSPNDNVSREQMATFLYRYANKKGIPMNTAVKTKFADDSGIASYAKTAVYAMNGSGVISGIGNHMFAPKATATRAQTAAVIDRMLKLK